MSVTPAGNSIGDEQGLFARFLALTLRAWISNCASPPGGRFVGPQRALTSYTGGVAAEAAGEAAARIVAARAARTTSACLIVIVSLVPPSRLSWHFLIGPYLFCAWRSQALRACSCLLLAARPQRRRELLRARQHLRLGLYRRRRAQIARTTEDQRRARQRSDGAASNGP